MTEPFIVTGVGRSGTTWIARALTACGVPCGHEHVFGPRGPMRLLRQGESSWMAVPYLGEHRRTTALRIVRDPLAVIRSLSVRGFLWDEGNVYTQFVAQHRPEILEPPDHLGRILRYVATWDAGLGLPTIRAEDGPEAVRIALDMLGLGRLWDPEAIEAQGRPNVSGVKPPKITWRQVRDHSEGEPVATRARQFGYFEEVPL